MTEEGKRCASKIGRSARGQVRLPSSVTLPPKLAFNKATCFTDRFYEDNRSHRQRATFSSGEGLYFYPTLHAREPLTISQNNFIFFKNTAGHSRNGMPCFLLCFISQAVQLITQDRIACFRVVDHRHGLLHRADAVALTVDDVFRQRAKGEGNAVRFEIRLACL